MDDLLTRARLRGAPTALWPGTRQEGRVAPLWVVGLALPLQVRCGLRLPHARPRSPGWATHHTAHGHAAGLANQAFHARSSGQMLALDVLRVAFAWDDARSGLRCRV